jgi:bifunctional non-homologous end joining protein LigD
LNREEFVVVGWSDPEGSRHRIGSLLLGYYTPDGKLIYAGRVGTGMPVAELERVWNRLKPIAVDQMPLSEPPPRGSHFGLSNGDLPDFASQIDMLQRFKDIVGA